MLDDLVQALQRPALWLYTTWIQFLIIYRRTALGPIWVILSPLAFIALLGLLFTVISHSEVSVFIPHLTIGFIVWTFISDIVGSSSVLYIRSKGALMSGVTNHSVFHLRSIAKAAIKFLHQVIIIIGVCIVFQVSPSMHLLLLFPAMLLLLIHAYWVSVLFSIVAARYRDISQLTDLVLRIGFLATPIIWMPTDSGRGSIIGSYLMANPFYHVLEPVRSAILGTAYPYDSLAISCVIALCGLLLASIFYARFRKKAVLWI
jgi:ABC-2 type transport system permease protein/lipopolysaccharide transport system permease protein